MMHWKNICDVLLTKNFQTLKRLDIIYAPLLNEAATRVVVEALNTFVYIETLRSCQDLNVTVKGDLLCRVLV